jgi:MoaA/NifB/PqqE/SkfB family radical SAM enzyme
MDPYIAPEVLDPEHPLTPLKLANLRRADEAHRAGAETVDALPSKIVLQTNDTCNLDCPHCQIPKLRKRATAPEALLDRVVAELFPTLIELHPTNTGEPLLWRHFARLCAEMERYGVLLDLTTNGTLLDSRRIGLILPIIRDLKISFDGATPRTFNRLRKGAQFIEVCANAQRIAAETPPGTVALQMTLMRSNAHELPELVQLADSLGVRRVKAYHLFSFRPEMDAESVVAAPDLWWPAVARATKLATLLGIHLQAAEPPLTAASHPPGAQGPLSAPLGLEPVRCHLPWHEAWIDLDGAVLPCHSHEGQLAGRLPDRPFSEVWNGEHYRRIRRGLAHNCPVGACAGCGMNWERRSPDGAVPYDPRSFLSPEARANASETKPDAAIRWSGRMRQFGLREERWTR